MNLCQRLSAAIPLLVLLTLLLPVFASAEIVSGEGLQSAFSFDDSTRNRLQPIPLSPDIEAAYRDSRFDECRTLLNALCEANPHLPPPDLIIAWLHLSSRKMTEAKMALERVAATHPNHPEVSLTLGQVALSEGRLADASAQLERASALTLPKAWTRKEQLQFADGLLDSLGTAYEQQHRWIEMNRVLTNLVAIRPRDVDSKNRLAQSCMLLGDEAQAERLLRTNVAEFPNNVQSYIGLACFELSRHRPQAASAIVTAAIQAGLSAELFDEISGDVAMMLGRFGDASTAYHRVLDRHPFNRNAKYKATLAMLCHESNEIQHQGKEQAEESALKAPSDPQSLALLGFAYLRLKQHDLARPLLCRAVELSPQISSDLAYFMAELLMVDETNRSEALKFLKAARDGSPGLFLMRWNADQLAISFEIPKL